MPEVAHEPLPGERWKVSIPKYASKINITEVRVRNKIGDVYSVSHDGVQVKILFHPSWFIEKLSPVKGT